MKLKFSFLVAMLLTLFLVLAACGGDDGEDSSSDSGSSDDGQSEEQSGNDGEESSESESGDEASSGDGEDILVYARGGDSESLDFASTTDGESSRVTKQIYESLLDFEKESFEIKPGLAHDWEVSDDGLTYTFHLEEGVTFHDGTKFNAEAVKTNFDRWSGADDTYAFEDEGYAYSMYGTMFGGFDGDEGHVIDSINVVDDHQIEFQLKRPLGFFLQNMAMSYFAITSPAALEEHGAAINENPVGTGPFKFVSWERDNQIELEAFEDYRKDGQPKLDGVVFEVIPDNSSRLIALNSGEVHIMDGLNPDDAAGVEEDDATTLYTRAANNFGYLGFQTEKEPINDATVRQAINHAINREEIAEAMYAGYAQPAVNPVPPNYLGYNDELELYEYDLERAQELLAEAGYEDGFEIDLWTMPVARPYMPDAETVATIIQSDLSEIGVSVNIVREEWAPYLEKTAAGEQEMFMLGWSGTNGDPDYFLSSLLHGDNAGSSNRSFYQNDEVDELLDQAKVATDQEERAELYKQTQEIIYEDSPMIPLVHSEPVLASLSSVQNYVPHPSTSESLAEVELE
ncbi:ABC transporter substrate-binding protein [Alkalibacillus almallahensis]|uniref:ABC transporter substrate-binding protein n=1 Tax=Alkalibacillus almallahensis TaxID=1379154 RepID=UPI001421651A|nr:ABC transporter substrate-binding protein [Alkalibacillus almallahensis]NIK10664.1 peptide/nickel transport system substrate-binding protein [Alkalibacillus almallahensis]